MKKLTLIISTSITLALIAGSVFAWGHGNGQGSQNCPIYNSQTAGNDQISNLTKEQTDELTALRQTFIDDTYELRSARMEQRQQIKLLMQTSTPDRAKLTDMYSEMDVLDKQLREKRLDYQLAVKKIAPDLNFGKGCGKGRGGMGSGGGYHKLRGSGYGGCNN